MASYLEVGEDRQLVFWTQEILLLRYATAHLPGRVGEKPFHHDSPDFHLFVPAFHSSFHSIKICEALGARFLQAVCIKDE